MARADSIASHVFEHRDLVTKCIFVHGSSERTKIMVVAHTFELTCLAVELETLFGRV